MVLKVAAAVFEMRRVTWTYLEFEVDGVFVPPKARGEMAGENERRFRPEMVLALFDRHGSRRKRKEWIRCALCCVEPTALMTRVEWTQRDSTR